MSWVANLFNQAKATRTGFVSNDDGQPRIFSNVQDYGDESTSKYRERWAGEYAGSMAEAEKEEEEYPRSPYWQVSQRCSTWDLLKL